MFFISLAKAHWTAQSQGFPDIVRRLALLESTMLKKIKKIFPKIRFFKIPNRVLSEKANKLAKHEGRI